MPVRLDRKHNRKSMWRASNQSESGNRGRKTRSKTKKWSDGEENTFKNRRAEYMDRLLQGKKEYDEASRIGTGAN